MYSNLINYLFYKNNGKSANLKKIIQTEMAGGAIPLHTPLNMSLNFANLRSH